MSLGSRLRRFGRSLRVAAAVGLAVCAGCGLEPLERGPRGGEEVVKDLLPELKTARVLRSTRRVEPGNPNHGGFLLEGWGRPETRSDSGESFAWVVGQAAGLHVIRLDGTAAEIGVVGWPFRWARAPAQRLELVVNGTSLGAQVLEGRNRKLTFSAPAGAFRPGSNRLELRFGYARQPAAVHPGSTDQRPLAAAIHRLEIAGSTPAARDASEPRVAEDGPFRLPADTGVAVRLHLTGDVALDLAVSTPEKNDGGSQRVVVWQTATGGSPAVLLHTGLAGHSSSWALRLPPAAESPVELVVAALGGELSIDRMRLVGHGETRRPPNVLLIVMDTLRADRVGSYGGAAHTPVIDGLAATGTLFERAYSHIAITGPSHASMFTSLYPFEHGVLNNAHILAEEHGTLTESLREHGWFTAGVVSLGVLMREYGIAQGFDVYRDEFPRDWMKNAGEVTDEALTVIEEGVSEPYFFWVHYSDPHEPYTPPGLDYPRARVEFGGTEVAELTADGRGYELFVDVPPGTGQLSFVLHEADPKNWYRVGNVTLESEHVELEAPAAWTVSGDASGLKTYTGRLPGHLELVNPATSVERVRMHFIFKRRLNIPQVKQRYLLEVEYADREIGRLLAELDARGLLDNTVVIFTSDHGEGLGDHNHLGHIHQVYDTLIRVPLIIASRTGLPAGRRVPDRVSLVDLYPTVADIVGIDGPPAPSGRSLLPLIRGEMLQPVDIIAETHRPEAFTDKRAIIRDGAKLIHSWSDERDWQELYDLDADPDELHDVVSERPELAAALREALEKRLHETAHGQVEAAELSQDDVDRLKALGYVR